MKDAEALTLALAINAAWRDLYGKSEDALTVDALVKRLKSIADDVKCGRANFKSTNAGLVEIERRRVAAIDLLRKIMEKLREENEKPEDPMYPFSFDAEWENLAIQADALTGK